MGFVEGLPVSRLISVVYVLALPGLVFIIWIVDLLRANRLEKKRDKEQALLLDAYREDVRAVTQFYKDNVLLVENYQKLANDLAGIIHLNTQVQTQLVEKIKNNMFCPIVREKGPS